MLKPCKAACGMRSILARCSGLIIRICAAVCGGPGLCLAAAQVGAQLCREPFLASHRRRFHSVPAIACHGLFIAPSRDGDKRVRLSLTSGPGPANSAPSQDADMHCHVRAPGCCSSVVERTLGKGEVGSSILPSSTISPCLSRSVAGFGTARVSLVTLLVTFLNRFATSASR